MAEALGEPRGEAEGSNAEGDEPEGEPQLRESHFKPHLFQEGSKKLYGQRALLAFQDAMLDSLRAKQLEEERRTRDYMAQRRRDFIDKLERLRNSYFHSQGVDEAILASHTSRSDAKIQQILRNRIKIQREIAKQNSVRARRVWVVRQRICMRPGVHGPMVRERKHHFLSRPRALRWAQNRSRKQQAHPYNFYAKELYCTIAFDPVL